AGVRRQDAPSLAEHWLRITANRKIQSATSPDTILRKCYQLTPAGRAVAVLFTKAYGRILGPGLAALDPGLPGDLAKRSPLATAWKDLDRQLDRFIDHGLARPETENLI
ncbi:MAG: hypothetical protein ACRDOK_16650, partial [Streptosporangiaceae bacterium]